MQKHEREAFKEASRVAETFGVRVTVEGGRKHLQLRLIAPSGRWAKLPIASSPRAGVRAQRNYARQATKRICNDLILSAEST